MSRLLLLGATGLVGGHLLRLALADARVSCVFAPTRRALPAQARLDNRVVDFEALSASEPFWAADAVACALGTTLRDAGSREAFRRVDVDHVLRCAELARAAGARSFALNSSVGAAPDARSFYLRCKAEAEAGVDALGFPSYTIVRPSVIGGERARRRPLEHAAMRALRAAPWLVPARYRVVDAGRIAQCLLDAALDAAPGRRIVESEAI